MGRTMLWNKEMGVMSEVERERERERDRMARPRDKVRRMDDGG